MATPPKPIKQDPRGKPVKKVPEDLSDVAHEETGNEDPGSELTEQLHRANQDKDRTDVKKRE